MKFFQIIHSSLLIIRQYTLVPAKGGARSKDGKVTVGQAKK